MATDSGATGDSERPHRKSILYTRTGDDGSTGLFSGSRVGKDAPRIEAYGSIDELNSCIGWARAELAALCAAPREGASGGAAGASGGHAPAAIDRASLELIERILRALQSRLFDLGADLATIPGSKFDDRVARMTDEDVREAEAWIDESDAANTPLRCFVLPGGSELASRLHLARTICRRAERAIVALGREEPVGEAVIRFVNRTSDLLFALARRANLALGVPDVPWSSRSTR